MSRPVKRELASGRDPHCGSWGYPDSPPAGPMVRCRLVNNHEGEDDHDFGPPVKPAVEARAPKPEPTTPLERIAHWAAEALDNDGALTADSSMSLDMAHDELTKAIGDYVGADMADKTAPRIITGVTTPTDWTAELAVAADRVWAIPEEVKSLEDMQAEVVAWAARKGWYDAAEDPRRITVAEKINPTFGEAVALITSEASEALEAYRNGEPVIWYRHAEGCAHESLNALHDLLPDRGGCTCAPKPEGHGTEFADILVRLLHYSKLFAVDLRHAYEVKMAHNERRPFRHGGKAL